MSTVCLNMIVRNEASVIRRCLSSVKPYISHWIIVDTGSDDDTRAIVHECLGDLPGHLYQRPWVDFSSNRNEALELARGHLAEHGQRDAYILVLDADEVWVSTSHCPAPSLTADVHRVLHRDRGGSVRFMLGSLVRASLECRYEGILHESLRWPAGAAVDSLPGVEIHGFFDGARNRDPIAKYLSDAAVLERVVSDDPRNARAVFYLAQSYRDAHQLEKSIEVYRRRVDLGGWAEEVWYSLYQVGEMQRMLGRHHDATLALLEAFACRPSRAEALVSLAAINREQHCWPAALAFAAHALLLSIPDDRLFLDESAYTWRPLDEYSVASYWVGNHADALRASELLLKHPALPGFERTRVENNMIFCRNRV